MDFSSLSTLLSPNLLAQLLFCPRVLGSCSCPFFGINPLELTQSQGSICAPQNGKKRMLINAVGDNLFMALITPDKRGHPCPRSFSMELFLFFHGNREDTEGRRSCSSTSKWRKIPSRSPWGQGAPQGYFVVGLNDPEIFSRLNPHPWNCPRPAWSTLGSGRC